MELVKDEAAQGKVKKTRADKGTKRVKPTGKKPGAALIDVLAALDGLPTADMYKVLRAARVFYDLEDPIDRDGV